ncbi:hypothetical protein ACFLTH_05720, partial [Bacteroidota bacterium]
VPLGAPRQEEFPEELKNKFKEQIKKNLRKELLSEVDAIFSEKRFKSGYQVFGFPDISEYSHEVIIYAKKAVEFLQEEIPDVQLPSVKWQELHHGENWNHNFHEKGFVGFRPYFMAILDFKLGDYKNRMFSPAEPVNGAHLGTYLKPNNQKEWFIFLPTNHLSLFAPFSEILPLLFQEAEKRSYQKNPFEGNRAMETLTEGISYHMGLKISKELNIPNGEFIVNEVFSNLPKENGVYSDVPKAIQWIEKHGIKEAVMTGQDNLKKFMEKILLYK